MEVSDEGGAGEEGGLSAINGVGTTAPDRAEQFRVHGDEMVSRVGLRVV